jgi:cobalt-zinc-cadmium efflux system outer membrane protein
MRPTKRKISQKPRDFRADSVYLRVLTTRYLFCVFLPVALLSGCASVSPNEAFKPVQDNVSSLSEHQVAWNQETAADQKAEAEVRHLLLIPLSANDAAQVALLNNPDLQATFEDIGISQADLVQAGLLKNPVFAASWRFPDVAPGITDAEYSLAQNFLSLVMMPLNIKVAKANLKATQDRVTHEVIKLIAEAKAAFYTYQAEIQLEQRLKLIIDADQAGADVAKAQHDSGNINDSTYLNQQAQLASAHLALTEEQKQKIATREKLNRLMGLWGDQIEWTAKPSLPELPDHDPSLDHLEALAISQRRDLLALHQQVDAIGQMLALKTNTRFLPASINVGVDTEKQTDGQRITGPTLDLELPIFDQGEGEIPKLAAQYRQAQRQLQSLVIRIRSEVRESRDTLKINRDQVAYFKKVVVPLNVQSVNQSLLQYNAMQVNTYDLFLAKQRELDSERDYIGAWRDYWISRTELEEAVGGNLHPIQPKP